MKPKVFYITLIILSCFNACDKKQVKQIPADVKKVILLTADKGKELEEAIQYYQNQEDTLKLEALYFLIRNMDQHYSEGYQLKTDTSENASFNTNSMGLLNQATPFRYKDIDTITSKFLIDHIEFAFKVWANPWSKHFHFDFFCEYILPYRVNTEPIQNWQAAYYQQFMPLVESLKTNDPLLISEKINSDLQEWFGNTFEFEKSNDILPLLGPMHLLNLKNGGCPDMVNLATYALRSVGLPVAVDFTPYWAASTGGHFWNYTFDSLRYGYSFMGAEENYESHTISKEMAKVYRIMYSKQPNAIAIRMAEDKITIPEFRNPYIMDVTKYYVKTANISLVADSQYNGQIAYLCVFNGMKWRPVDATLIIKDSMHFNDVGTGTVCLPMIDSDQKLRPLSEALLLDKNGALYVLSPKKTQKIQLTISNKMRYLALRKGKKYTLFYWENRWHKIESRYATNNDKITFEDVPLNALLIMVPEYSQGKERIFTIGTNKDILYW